MVKLDQFKDQIFNPLYKEKMIQALTYYRQNREILITQWLKYLNRVVEVLPVSKDHCRLYFGLAWTDLFTLHKVNWEVVCINGDSAFTSLDICEAARLFHNFFYLNKNWKKSANLLLAKLLQYIFSNFYISIF